MFAESLHSVQCVADKTHLEQGEVQGRQVDPLINFPSAHDVHYVAFE